MYIEYQPKPQLDCSHAKLLHLKGDKHTTLPFSKSIQTQNASQPAIEKKKLIRLATARRYLEPTGRRDVIEPDAEDEIYSQ